MNMSKVVERLKAAGAEESSEAEENGHMSGSDWASNDATPAQLRRLAKAQDGHNEWYIGVGSSAYTESERIAFLINPIDDGDRHAAARFWEAATDGLHTAANDDENAFLLGFCRGAMEVWSQVKDRV